MTNEEREALIAQGWTPPVEVDPDLAEAETLWGIWFNAYETPLELAIKAIKRGRALAAAEAKPGVVWVKHDGENYCPIAREQYVLTASPRGYKTNFAQQMFWQHVTHYAIITPPEDVA